MAFGSRYYMPRWRALTPDSVTELRSAGVSLWVWPARRVSEYEAAARVGPDAIVGDHPAELLAWLAEAGYRPAD